MIELDRQRTELLMTECDAPTCQPGYPRPECSACGGTGRRPKTTDELLEHLDLVLGYERCLIGRDGTTYYAHYYDDITATGRSRREAVAQLVVDVATKVGAARRSR